MRYLNDTSPATSEDAEDVVPQRRTKKRRVGDVIELWGCLIPCNATDPDMHSIELSKAKRRYTVGCSSRADVCISGRDVDETHCIIEWDGAEGNAHYAVKVTDCSARGTYINGRAVCEGGNKFAVLRDGSEIQFGPRAGGIRFIYRQVDNDDDSIRGLNKHYDLFNVLGQGSFGTVVKALHKQQGKWYAVKMIPVHSLQQGVSDEEARVKTTHRNIVLREVEILESCQHPNICQLKEVFLEGGRLNLVLELMHHGSLAAYMNEMGVLFEHQAQPVSRQICDALAFLHDRGIVHRDVKPENLLLASRNPLTIKVSDFGLAKHIDTFRDLRTACGTRAYAAPEVTDPGSKGHYDEKVDSWSVGVAVFKILTLQFPFSERYLTGHVGKKASRRDAQVDWSLLPDFNVSDIGQDFIRLLLEYDPKRRWSLTQALDHAWIAEHEDPLDKLEDSSLDPRLRSSARTTTQKNSKATVSEPTDSPRKTRARAPRSKVKDPTEDLIKTMSSMSIAESPVSSRTRGKQKVTEASAPASTAVSTPSESVPGLGQARRSARIAAMNTPSQT